MPQRVYIILINMFELFHYPFMIRALVAGGIVAILLGWLGSFIVTRNMSFVGDGIAHASLAGIALALLVGWATLPTAIVFAIIIAIGIYVLQHKTPISSDMAIAILFTTGLAIGVMLLHLSSGYQPELMSYLFGNILTVSTQDVITIVSASCIILILLAFTYHKILFTTFDPDGAYLAGVTPWKYDIMLYIVTAIAVVLSIKIVGIVLVSALLVTPSAISKLFATSFASFTFFSVLLSFVIVFVGLLLSYYLNVPSGATIILTGTSMFIVSSIFVGIRKKLV